MKINLKHYALSMATGMLAAFGVRWIGGYMGASDIVIACLMSVTAGGAAFTTILSMDKSKKG